MDIIRGGDIIGSINGTIRGGVSLVPGKHGSALFLNGIDGRVYYGMHLNECFHLPEMCTTGSTFAYWLRYKTPDIETTVFDSGGVWVSSHGYAVRVMYDGEVIVSVKDIAYYYSGRAFNYDPDIWLFIVHTWSPSSGIVLYLNVCIMNNQVKKKHI